MASSSQRVSDEKDRALSLVARIAACGEALQEILATIPPTPSVPGGQAEAALLRHHLGACARLREARQICQDLKTEQFAVVPGEKIYMNPGVVPLLLSTRPQQPTEAVKLCGSGPVPSATPASRMARLKRRKELCDSLSTDISKDLARLLQD
ncbi:MCM7, partial [Symbiodinium pilosum]